MTDLSLPHPSPAAPLAALDRALDRPAAQRGAMVFGCALIWAALVRAPFLRVEGIDDSFYTELAHLWTKGVAPYAGAYDVKPPGFFALLAVSQLVFGPTLLALRAVSILSDAVAAAALFGLGRRVHSTALGLFAGLVYPILSLCIHGSEAYAPLEAATACAFLAALSDLAPLRRAAFAGLAVGAACAIKQTAALEGLVVFCAVLAAPVAAGRRAPVALTFIATAAAVPLAFLAYFAARGAAGPLLEQAVAGAFFRPASAAVNLTFADGLWRFFPLQRTLLWLVMASLLALARADAVRAAAPGARLGMLAGWLVAAWASILVQRSMTIVYLGPLIAPTLLLGGLGVTAGLPLKQRYPEPLRLLALGLASAVMAVQIPGAHLDRASPADALAAAAKIVRDAGPAPTDKLLVVNRGILLNAATDLDPPTKIIFTAHALCDFAPESRAWMAAELDARPRFVVIADRARAAVCELPERWAMVDAALAADYREIGRAPGATESFSVYERR